MIMHSMPRNLPGYLLTWSGVVRGGARWCGVAQGCVGWLTSAKVWLKVEHGGSRWSV